MESDREIRSPLATDPAQNLASTAPGAAPVTPADDELQGVIADVERQLASLRTYRTQHEEARLKWQAVEQELARRAAEVAMQVAEVAAERAKLAQDRATHTSQQAELASKAERIEKDFQSLAEEQRRAAEASEKREADFAGRATTLEQREQRLVEQAASISKQREQVQALEADLAQRERTLAERAAQLDQRTQAMAALEARAATLETDAKRTGEELERARAQCQERDASLAERVKEIEGLKAEVVRSGEAQSELMRSLTKREESYREIKGALKEAVSRMERAKEALASSEQSVADFKRQVIDRDGRIQELSGKLASATGKLREVSEGIREQAEMVGQARDLEARLSDRTGQVAALEAELAEVKRALNERPESIPDAGVLAERETLRLRSEELEEQVLQAQQRLEKAAAEIGRLRERLESAPADAGRGFAGVPEEVGEAIVSRWRRLRLMRSMLREQADKVRQAGEALRSRYDEVEKIATDRQNLARERAAFAAAKSSLDVKPVARAKTSAIGASAYAAVAIAALAGLSWAIGGQLAPATYEARSTISADGHGGTPSSDQLAEWQKYHEGLLKDPALTELTAERMGRRGIVSLGTPGALMSKLDTDLSTQSASPGQLTIQLRGKGAAETARILDTYVTALVSQANADRERRSDGLATSIGEAASTGSGPVEDPRLLYAGITFVVGVGLSLGVGALTLGRLNAAKDRMEHAHEEQDNPAEWEKPPQEYAR